MAESVRPDPDALLASLKRDEARAKRGRLKIFLGMCPGVGKTYAMLQAAQQARVAGTDLLVGLVETHGRVETQKLIEGLPVLPRATIVYHDATREEFDLDTALARKPVLVLVDELAHTNIPGSRHNKRFQDVEELLAAGIDVFTTLNVQHIESRADTVRQITGITVRETVPDSIFEAADEIQLVDLTPAQLRERLAEGQVYLGDRAATAAENFFKETNLTALRELALRLTAERVDKQLRAIRSDTGTGAIWRSGERLLVAVSASPFSARLIRWTRRMAYALDAPWLAVHIDSVRPLEPEEQRRLDENLTLARELGAEIVIVPDQDIASALVRVARQHNVSQIVVGKPQGRSLTEFFRGGSLVDRLVRRSGQIDIYVVPGEGRTGRYRWQGWDKALASQPREYGWALATVAGVTVASRLAVPFTGYSAVSLFYLTGVICLGLFTGQGPILLAAALSALAWNFLFIPPLFTFRIDKLEDGLMFALFFVIALVTGRLTGRLRVQQRNEAQREQRATALYQLTRAIGSARTIDEVGRQAAAQVQELFGARVALFAADGGQPDGLRPLSTATYEVGEKERSVASWVFRNRKIAGRFTDTLPAANAFYAPLAVADRCLGVIGVKPPEGERLVFAQRDMLETFAAQIALALEREALRSSQEKMRLAEASERLQRTLLDSVSHELKTPLAVIAGAAENLAPTALPASLPLISELKSAAQRLQRLVNNLLDLTRVETGSLKPRLDWVDAGDLINSVLENTKEVRRDRATKVDLPSDLPLLHIDFALIEQSLVNLVHNACVHTPPTAEIRISASVDEPGERVLLAVSDTGPGLSPEFVSRAFDKFQRGTAARAGGLGLGLSIVRGFVEAHGGSVEATNQSGGGARFTIYLPLRRHGKVPTE